MREWVDHIEDQVLAKLKIAFGADWRGSMVFRHERKWWQRGYAEEQRIQRALERVGLDRITPAGRVRFQEQLREGQGYDDATGFFLRCWLAALGLPYKPAWVSRSAIR